jgi:hypothetical protein
VCLSVIPTLRGTGLNPIGLSSHGDKTEIFRVTGASTSETTAYRSEGEGKGQKEGVFD